MSITVGIDISKLKFDVCILKEDGSLRTETFKNNESGFKKLGYLIKRENSVYAGLESTGVYGENLCQFLYDKGYKVFLLNPSQTSYYAKCMMKRTKTDKCDSKNSAQFVNLHKGELNLWKPKPKEAKIAQKLFKCLQDLKEDKIRVQGRIEASSFSYQDGKSVDLKIYQKQKKGLEKQIEEVTEQIETLIEKSKK
jgi:transposase